MNVTEPIIQAALLGTANREFAPEAFPESLQTLVDRIREKAEDTESFLYMTAASVFAYRRAGWEPSGAEGIVPVGTAPEEELPYFGKDQSQLFSRLHGTRYMLAYAYRLVQGAGKIISPEYLQPLIRRAYDRNNPLRFEERRLLKGLAGNRGLWLTRQMGLAGEECGNNDSWDTVSAKRCLPDSGNRTQPKPLNCCKKIGKANRLTSATNCLNASGQISARPTSLSYRE